MTENKLILQRKDGSRAEVVMDNDASYTTYLKAFYTLMSFATFPEYVQEDILGGNPWNLE